MGVTQKLAGVILGAILIFASFLFFGRQQYTYQIILIAGLMISLLFYGTIIFGKHSVKLKIISTLIVVLFVTIEQLAEPALINTSYRIFIRQNINELSEVNKILTSTSDNIEVWNDDIKSENSALTPQDKQRLLTGRQKLGVYMISKSKDRIYYGLWGFLDVRVGVIYWIGKLEPGVEYRHLTDRWYH